jgi:molybdate-binding protein
VRLCRIGGQLLSIPANASPSFLPEADGVVARAGKTGVSVNVVAQARDEALEKRLILAGCDPAAGVLAGMVANISGVEIVPASASSKLALSWLKQGVIHIAGSHLEDPSTGEFNLPYLRREFPGDDFAVVTFAWWEEGLVTAAGNPKGISRAEHLARGNVRFRNRELGSGSRALADRLLQAAGLPSSRVRGYHSEAFGHLAAAYAVLSGEADCCIATRSAARTFGLDFLPLKSERYDLIMRRQTMGLPAVQAFLDVLQRGSLRRKLEVLAGYDTRQTGAILA